MRLDAHKVANEANLLVKHMAAKMDWVSCASGRFQQICFNRDHDNFCNHGIAGQQTQVDWQGIACM
jgi:hypothetical protein